MKTLAALGREQALRLAGAGVALENHAGGRHGGIEQSAGFSVSVLLESQQGHSQSPEVFILGGSLGDDALALGNEIVAVLRRMLNDWCLAARQ